MSYIRNYFKGAIQGSIIGVLNRDIRRFDPKPHTRGLLRGILGVSMMAHILKAKLHLILSL